MDYTFHLEVTHVRNPGRGSGKRKNGTKLGIKHIQQMLKSKKSVVVINKDDELCCARALLTTKAYQDQDPRYRDIRQGRPVQGKWARELHWLVDVLEGPRGLNEIALFQLYLFDYQIVVKSVDHSYQIYKGPEQAEDKQLILIKDDAHFHAWNSIKGFFVWSVRRNLTTPILYIIVVLMPNVMLVTSMLAKIKRKPRELLRWSVDFVGVAFLVPPVSVIIFTWTIKDAKQRWTVSHTHKKCTGCRKVLKKSSKERKKHFCGCRTCPCWKENVDLSTH